jgi:hypothetical protein
MDFLSDMGGFAMSMIMQKFWMHHIYAVTEHDREVEVIGVQKQLCSPDAKVFTELFNRYAVIGKVKDVHVSPNGKNRYMITKFCSATHVHYGDKTEMGAGHY